MENNGWYTRVPNSFIDWLMADCTGAEVAVFLYLCRRINGFQRRDDAISVRQVCDGVRAKDGAILERGSGLDLKTAVKALRKLEARGIIRREHGTGRKADRYMLTVESAVALEKVQHGALEKVQRKTPVALAKVQHPKERPEIKGKESPNRIESNRESTVPRKLPVALEHFGGSPSITPHKRIAPQPHEPSGRPSQERSDAELLRDLGLDVARFRIPPSARASLTRCGGY